MPPPFLGHQSNPVWLSLRLPVRVFWKAAMMAKAIFPFAICLFFAGDAFRKLSVQKISQEQSDENR